jgi:hypothetical protein
MGANVVDTHRPSRCLNRRYGSTRIGDHDEKLDSIDEMPLDAFVLQSRPIRA